ncbi:nitric oxide synthase-interacting protein [Haliaeetus albicilla]|uniref:nitric oxide synthase-interacting protein n=1 Tax=Haliaeetus albicilla TaxID=8969 RepID=UPI0037E79704
MTRHGKNCTAGAVYTYHEKKKDTAASGYGTQRVRVGRDAVKDFDCCCLSLQPCRDPVVTPDGFLYEREAILGYPAAPQERDRPSDQGVRAAAGRSGGASGSSGGRRGPRRRCGGSCRLRAPSAAGGAAVLVWGWGGER